MILVVGYSWIFRLCPFMFTYVHLCPFMSTYVHVCPFIIVLRCFKWNVTMSDKLGPLFGGGLLQVSWTDSDFQIERIDMIYPFISIYHILIIYFVWYLPHIYIICSYIYIHICASHVHFAPTFLFYQVPYQAVTDFCRRSWKISESRGWNN
jgi:hypothetical protein